MIIKFKNWEKYNVRKDLKKPWYFNFSNDFFQETKLYELDNDERLFLIYLLCEASRSNKNGEFFLSRKHYRIHSRLSDRVFNRGIKKLQSLQVIEEPSVQDAYGICTDHVQICTDHVQQIRQEQIRLDKSRKENILLNSPKVELEQNLDFNLVYQNYPRKIGKKKGLVMCKAQIKTQEDYNLLLKAIEVYKAHLVREGTEPKFIKHFATFMTTWRDWLDADAGTVVNISPAKEEPEWVKEAKKWKG